MTKTATPKERGTDLLATLMQLIEERVDQHVDRVPNKSETYTRLKVGGKTFAYIFPPRDAGLAVKIPKNLVEIEASLPAGHGFKRTGWGLTRTIKHASEAPKAAQALAVAAAAATKEKGEAVEAAVPAKNLADESPAATPNGVVVRVGSGEARPDPKPEQSPGKSRRGSRQKATV